MNQFAKAIGDDTASVTGRIMARIAEMRFEDFPPELLASVRMLVMDGIAVAVAGAQLEKSPSLVGEYLGSQGGSGDIVAFGMARTCSAVSAALLNGTSMHVLDYEPMWKPATHALSPVLSATLALAQMERLDGRAIIEAVVRGIEIQGWLREAGKVESRELRFHPPGVVGPIGSAVACATLLGFDGPEMANAIGLASSRCGSLFTNLGTMTKSTHCGHAAAAGLEAALLTRLGFSADRTAFDDKRQGYFAAFMPTFDIDTFLRFGERYRILDPGFAIKIYPAKFSTHYGIQAALELHPQLPDPGRIESVDMVAAEVPSSDRPFPSTGLDGKFSMQYTAAAALLDGKVDFSTFTDGRLKRDDMQALLPKIRLAMPAEMPSHYNSGRYAEITVRMKGDEEFKARCYTPRGSWGGAPISKDEHLGKVRSCLETCQGAATIDAFIALGSRFEELNGDEVRHMLQLASAKGSA